MESQSVYLISNGTSQYYENTLSKFTNCLSELYTKKNAVFDIAVSQLILDDRFPSLVIPSNNAPPIIISKLKPTEIKDLKLL